MRTGRLEHVNITVSDPVKTAERLSALFDWKVRWQGQPGQSINGGTSLHVGSDDSYVAVYTNGKSPQREAGDTYATVGGLNHVGVVVDDLDGVEKRVLAAGYETHSHADYEPGRRFYFDDEDGIEWEVVSYG